MLRPLAFLTLILTTIFAAAIGSTRLHTNAQADLRDLFAGADGCVSPCFLGITPNETTPTEAVALLESHPLVESVFVPPNVDAPYSSIGWDWRTNADLPLDQYRNYVHLRRGVVDSIELHTAVPFGQTWVALGQPDRGRYSWGGGVVQYVVGYEAQGVEVAVNVSICATRERMFETPASIIFTDDVVPIVISTGVRPYFFYLQRPTYWSEVLGCE